MYIQGNLKPSSISETIQNNKVIRKIEYCYPVKEYKGTEMYCGTSIFKIELNDITLKNFYKRIDRIKKSKRGNVSSSQLTTESSTPHTQNI